MSQSAGNMDSPMIETNDLLLKLYIPFCYHKCSYCGLPVCSYDEKVIQAHGKAMLAEIEAAAEDARESTVRAVSIEGGSPALTSPALLQELLRSVRRNFTLAADVQISIQTMPGQYSRTLVQRLRDSGVNLWTIGLETAEPAEHNLLERPYRFDALTMVDTAIRTFHMRDLHFELLYGIPGQTIHSWRHSLDMALAYEPEQISLNPLRLIPGTPLADRCARGETASCSPEAAVQYYEYARERLTDLGYQADTVYDFSKPGHENRYRMALLRGTPHMGFGYQADSCLDGICYTNGHSLKEYLEHSAELPVIANHVAHMDSLAELLRFVTASLTLSDGLDVSACHKRFGTLFQPFLELFSYMTDNGFLEERQNGANDGGSAAHTHLTPLGIASGQLYRISEQISKQFLK